MQTLRAIANLLEAFFVVLIKAVIFTVFCFIIKTHQLICVLQIECWGISAELVVGWVVLGDIISAS